MSAEIVAWSEESSDAELITAARGGDPGAFGALYERHSAAARTVARQYTRSSADAEDVVGDAFARVLSIVRGGGGPDVAFRAYLFTVVRRLAQAKAETGRRVQPTDDMATFESAFGTVSGVDDPALAGFERGVVARAYSALPERWQAVLWYTEIERLPPAQVAPLLGLTANGVAALAYRAREGLRESYLQQHLVAAPSDGCRAVNARLGAYVRGGLAKRESASVRAHLESCAECRTLVLELGDVNHGLRGIIAPLVLGVAGLGALAAPLPVGALASVAAGGAGSGAAAGTAGGGAAAGTAAAGTSGVAGSGTAGVTAVGTSGAGATAGAGAGIGTAAAGTAAAGGSGGALAGAATGAGTAATGSLLAGGTATAGTAGAVAGTTGAGLGASGALAGTQVMTGAAVAGSTVAGATSGAAALGTAGTLGTTSLAGAGITGAVVGSSSVGATAAGATALTTAAASAVTGVATASGATALSVAGAAGAGAGAAAGGIGGLIAAIPGGVAGAVTAGVVGVSLAVGGAIVEEPAPRATTAGPAAVDRGPSAPDPGLIPGTPSPGTGSLVAGPALPLEAPPIPLPAVARPAAGPSAGASPAIPAVAPGTPPPAAGGPARPSPAEQPTPVALVAESATGTVLLLPGTEVTVSISVRNTGSTDAADLRAALELPAGVQPTGPAGAGDWQPCADVPAELCLPSLPGSSAAALSVTVAVAEDVAPAASAPIVLRVSAAGASLGTLAVPAAVPDSPAELSVDGPRTSDLVAGVPALLPFDVANRGRTPARDVTATVTLPAGVRWVGDGAETAPWSCVPTGSGVTCALPELAARTPGHGPGRAGLALTLQADAGAADVPGLRVGLSVSEAGGVARSHDVALIVRSGGPGPTPVDPGAPGGQGPGDQKAGGQTPGGQRPGGQTSGGQRPGGQGPDDQAPNDQRPKNDQRPDRPAPEAAAAGTQASGAGTSVPDGSTVGGSTPDTAASDGTVVGDPGPATGRPDAPGRSQDAPGRVGR